MSEEEKEEIELDIEAKYVGKTEKEFLSRVTYAECLYILTLENKYCDEIKKLSVLKLCKIIENQQKEIKELKEKEKNLLKQLKDSEKELLEVTQNVVSKDKIRERIKELEGQEDWYIENKSLDDLYGRIDELKELLEEE